MKTTVTLLILFTVFSLNTFAQLPYISLEGHKEGVGSVAFSPDGGTLASGSDDDTIKLWDVATGHELRTLQGHTHSVYSVAFSPDGSKLASGSSDDTIKLWDVATGRELRTLQGHTHSVYSVAFSPDGSKLASGSSDDTIKLWDVATGRELRTLIGHTGDVQIVSFSPDGGTLASGSDDRTIRLWDVAIGIHKQTFFGIWGSVVRGVAFSPDGRTLISGSSQGFTLWHIDSGNFQEGFRIGGSGMVVLSPDGQTLAEIGGLDIELLHVPSGKVQQTLNFPSRVRSGSFSPDGGTLASGHRDGTILLWDLSTQVNITPSSLESPVIGEQFTVDVNIVGGQDVRGYRINLEYSARALRYVSHTHGDYLPGDVFIGPARGQVSLNVASATGAGNGDGTLATITFEVVAQRASTFLLSVTLSNSDGKRLPVFVRYGSVIEPPWDVNHDRSVDIFDLSFVAARFGQNGQTEADVNRDGVVDIKDLILVASGMENGAAAPTTSVHNRRGLPTKMDVQKWLSQAQQLNLTDPTLQKGILFLENLLAALTPKETALLPNYPNPFNPETWLPYQLSEPANVSIAIYAVDGTMVRTLMLGHQPVGIYQDKSRAAYWDGRNALGEPVASGVYFYTLFAGDFTATRKMLIRK